MINLLWVIFAHFLADWSLQDDFVANNKGRYWIIMLAHCMVWTGVISIVLASLDILTLWKLPFLFFGHWFMDKMKVDNIKVVCSASKEVEKHNLNWLYVDQAWHIVQCCIVFFIK